MGHEAAMFGSDGYAFSPTGRLAAGSGDHKTSHVSGKPHPRNYGTYPRVLGRYVREEQVLSLETAVRKMTALPARRLGLKDRGRVEQGLAADLVLFNPDTVTDKATFDDPSQFPDGIPPIRGRRGGRLEKVSTLAPPREGCSEGESDLSPG